MSLKMVMKRKMQYFVHFVRAGGLQRLLNDGKVEGTRSAQRTTWAKDITIWAGMDYSKCIRLASVNGDS